LPCEKKKIFQQASSSAGSGKSTSHHDFLLRNHSICMWKRTLRLSRWLDEALESCEAFELIANQRTPQWCLSWRAKRGEKLRQSGESSHALSAAWMKNYGEHFKRSSTPRLSTSLMSARLISLDSTIRRELNKRELIFYWLRSHRAICIRSISSRELHSRAQKLRANVAHRVIIIPRAPLTHGMPGTLFSENINSNYHWKPFKEGERKRDEKVQKDFALRLWTRGSAERFFCSSRNIFLVVWASAVVVYLLASSPTSTLRALESVWEHEGGMRAQVEQEKVAPLLIITITGLDT
jgi:hypothetical protein